MALQLAALAFFSVMAYWTQYAAMWIIAGAASFFTGWYWYDTFTNNLGMAFGVLFLMYGLSCWVQAIRQLFARDSE